MPTQRSRLLSRRALLDFGFGFGAAALGLDLFRGDDVAAVALAGVTGVVNTDRLNVHSYPSSSRPVVGQLPGGTVVACRASAARWLNVRGGGLSGWVSSPYITLRPAVSIRTIERGPTTSAHVCLTFDAGADRGHAGAILDILAAKSVIASFGITGRWANANPDLVARAVNAGHTLVNHTLTHRSWTGYSDPNVVATPAERLTELFATERALTAACGRGARPWFRPPYGDYDAGVLNDVAAAGFAYNLMWTVDSLGWNGLGADDIVARCLTNRGNGAIYLFHVMSQSADAAALPRVIDGLRSHGYRFRTIQGLLGLSVSAADDVAPTLTPTQAGASPTRAAFAPAAPMPPTKAAPSPSSTAMSPPTANATPSPMETPTNPAPPGGSPVAS